MLIIVLEDKTSSIIRIFFNLKCGAIDGIASSFCPIMSTRIHFVLILFQMILIFIYWFNILSKPNLVSNSLNQVVFFAVSIKTTYLIFVNVKAIITCLLVYQLTNPLFSIKIKPKIDFFIMQLLVQSELEYLFIERSSLSPSSPPQIILTDLIVLRYLMIVLTAFVYWQKRFLVN